MNVRTLGVWGLWAAGLAVLIGLPLVSDMGTVSTLNQIGIAIIFALAYNLLLGQSGLLSFGHAVYLGVGAFFTIQAMVWINDGLIRLPTPLLPLAGALGGLLFGFVLGIFCTRRYGTIFALITLAVGELMTALTLMLDELSGGEEGISAWRPAWAGISFGSSTQVYYLVLVWVLLCAGLMYGLTRTPFGRMMLAVRDNPERAQFIGFNTYWMRLLVFTLSGMFAGIAGGLMAVKTEIINYDSMGLMESANVLFNTYIGGMGYFSGPILGATLLTTLQLNLSNYTSAWLVYQGILFILVVLFAHDGLAGLLYAHGPVLRGRLIHKLLPAYGLGALLAAPLTASSVFMIEFIFRWSSQSYAATPFELFGTAWSPASLLPWLLIVGGLALGLLAIRYAIAVVRKGWEEVNDRLREPTAS